MPMTRETANTFTSLGRFMLQIHLGLSHIIVSLVSQKQGILTKNTGLKWACEGNMKSRTGEKEGINDVMKVSIGKGWLQART